jgi:acetyltransferase EpsM
MSGERLVVIGAGGHAKVAIATAHAAGCRVEAAFDDDEARWGSTVLGVPVRGPVEAAATHEGAVIAIGDNLARRTIARKLAMRWISIVHPSAVVHDSVTIGEGTVVFAGAVVQPGVALGEHVIVNTGSTIDHDCRVDHFAHVAPGVHLAGQVVVGEGSLVGIGASVIPGTRIGRWATVVAGAVLVRDVEDGCMDAGAAEWPRARHRKARPEWNVG